MQRSRRDQRFKDIEIYKDFAISKSSWVPRFSQGYISESNLKSNYLYDPRMTIDMGISISESLKNPHEDISADPRVSG